MGSKHPNWFAEPPLHGFQQRFETLARVFRRVSPYQTVEILDTVPFGRMLVLNGAVQTTERDEFIYHEMLTLVPMVTHGNCRRVAIIGGGDGGALRRVLQFPFVEEVVQIELDPEVTRACREYLPGISANAFNDPRAKVIFQDGATFLQSTQQRFDVILVDSTDPVGPAEVLFSEQFYTNAHSALAEGGILVTQSGSPLLMADELRRAVANVRKVFHVVRTYLAFIPSYPGTLWSFTLGSKGCDPLELPYEEVERRWRAWVRESAYYNPDVHFACFALPRFLALGVDGGSGFDILKN